MKKTLLTLTTILTAVMMVFLVSCGGDNTKMHDLDNTIEEAVPLKLGQSVEIKVKPEGNKNWFQVDVPEQGYLKVSVQNEPGDIRLMCYYAKYEEWEDKKTKRISDYLSMPATIKVDEGTYHFVIQDRYDNRESDEVITMKVDFIKEFDTFENNDKSDDAKAVELNSEFQIAVFPAGDYNWFKVNADTAGIIKIMAKSLPDGIELIAEFYEYDEWASPKVNKISDILVIPAGFAVHKPGEYYFRLKDRWDKKYSQELIDIKLDFEKQKDEYEPNDKFTQAKEIKDGELMEISIYPTGDRDYFKITPEKDGELSLKIRGETGNLELASKFFVINPDDPSKLIKKSDDLSLPAKFNVEADVEYIFYIKDRWDKKQHPELFEVMVEML